MTATPPPAVTRRRLLGCTGLALSAFLWVSTPPLELGDMTDLGLLSVLPLTFYLSLAALSVSFTLTLLSPRPAGWLLAAHLGLFVVIIHGTPAAAYGTLRYAWAWKHLGVVDYILRTGTVDRAIDTLGVYHNWPGFFAASALFFRAAGLERPLDLAGVAAWAPVFFNLLNLGALYLLFREFAAFRHVWLALWFVTLTSWVGQDYFSPQAFALFCHLVVLGVAVRWLTLRAQPYADAQPPSRSATGFGVPAEEVGTTEAEDARLIPHDAQVEKATASESAAAVAGTASRHGPRSVGLDARPVPKGLLITTLLLLAGLFAVLSSSHQLTPIVTALSLLALALFTRNRALGLPALMAVMMTTWIVYGATNFVQGELGEVVQEFGQLGENIEGTLLNLAEVSRAQQLVSYAGRALTLGVWGLAFVGVARHVLRWRWRADWGRVALTGAPFLLLAGNAYGGEVLFRVYLFSLPFMALWTASLFFPEASDDAPRRPGIATGALIGVLSVLFLSGFLVAYYGKEQQFYFSPQEIEAVQALYRAAPEGSLIAEGSPNYPSRFTHYEDYTHVPLSREPQASRERLLADPAAELEGWLSGGIYTGGYLILTRSQRAQVNALGELPRGSLERIERELKASPAFETFFENDDAVIFTLRSPPRQADRASSGFAQGAAQGAQP